ncbi:esterase-like activity of phytase family protein, partial [Xanthomonas hortorum pv. pelargonii]
MHLNLLLTAGLATLGLLTTCTQDAHVTTGIAVPAHTETAPPQIDAPSDRHRFTFPPTTRVGNVPLTELSALAWDADEQRLYALSDNGYVFHFRLTLDGDEIVRVEPVHSAALVDAKAGLTSDAFNAEG